VSEAVLLLTWYSSALVPSSPAPMHTPMCILLAFTTACVVLGPVPCSIRSLLLSSLWLPTDSGLLSWLLSKLAAKSLAPWMSCCPNMRLELWLLVFHATNSHWSCKLGGPAGCSCTNSMPPSLQHTTVLYQGGRCSHVAAPPYMRELRLRVAQTGMTGCTTKVGCALHFKLH
jgi:hypothetical protein